MTRRSWSRAGYLDGRSLIPENLRFLNGSNSVISYGADFMRVCKGAYQSIFVIDRARAKGILLWSEKVRT